MALNKKWIANSFFVIQILGAFVLSGAQFFRFLHTTEGYALSMLLLMEGFLILHLVLAINSHRHAPSQITSQQIKTFLLWVVLIGSNVIVFCWNSERRWNHNDTVTTTLALSGGVAVFIGTKLTGRDWRSPMPKGLLAILFKAWPQTMMAINIAQFGNAGVPGWAVIAGHVTVCTRVAQATIAVLENPQEKNRIWLLVSEVLNELSWVGVTVVWLTR